MVSVLDLFEEFSDVFLDRISAHHEAIDTDAIKAVIQEDAKKVRDAFKK
jgi:hypothetical protein